MSGQPPYIVPIPVSALEVATTLVGAEPLVVQDDTTKRLDPGILGSIADNVAAAEAARIAAEAAVASIQNFDAIDGGTF